jgi:hypothetical protein
VIRHRQVRRNEPDSRQRDDPVFERGQNRREAARCPGRLDSVVRRAFSEV